jgi:hypothetical protein
VKADSRLPASCFKVAFQLAQKTNTAELEKFGTLVTWQSIPTMADAIQMSERTVRDMVSRLQAAGHLEIESGHGPGNSNRYTLKYRQPAAAFNEANTGSGLPHSDEQMRQLSVRIAAVERTNSGSRLPPNYSISNSIISARAREEHRESESASCGPRSLEGLGPLGPLEAELRRRLGENFKWFAMAKLVERTADTVTLSVLTASQRDAIRKHCESDILTAAGASRLEFIVEIAADPPKARRRP